MSERTSDIPVVMSFAGLDPTGGAGLQADIEAISSMGCHAAPVITTATVQDTRDVKMVTPLPTTQVIAQARAVLDDVPVAAFKLGLLGSVETVEAIHTILVQYRGLPVVFDPVLASGSGEVRLADDEMIEAMISLVCPLTTVFTPNVPEARSFARAADTPEAIAQQLMSYGCEYVLLTGTHADTPEVRNTLYTNMRRVQAFSWERLPGVYHGSGCTLASAIAGMLAHGREPVSAIHAAQEYTFEALRRSYRIGRGQRLPNRLFWARDTQGNDE